MLHDLERLGSNSESFDNKIALCKDCHGTQDYQTTKNDYLHLLNIKKRLLSQSALEDATQTLGLENDITIIVDKLTNISEEDYAALNYKPIEIAKKFSNSEHLLKNKIAGYVFNYYTFIRDCMRNLDGKNGFHQQILSEQIHSCFEKMNYETDNKSDIFDYICNWVKNKTQNTSIEACEAVVAFFVQNCEVFNEISE